MSAPVLPSYNIYQAAAKKKLHFWSSIPPLFQSWAKQKLQSLLRELNVILKHTKFNESES